MIGTPLIYNYLAWIIQGTIVSDHLVSTSYIVVLFRRRCKMCRVSWFKDGRSQSPLGMIEHLKLNFYNKICKVKKSFFVVQWLLTFIYDSVTRSKIISVIFSINQENGNPVKIEKCCSFPVKKFCCQTFWIVILIIFSGDYIKSIT